jgi:hypothetical protein
MVAAPLKNEADRLTRQLRRTPSATGRHDLAEAFTEILREVVSPLERLQPA